MQLDFINLITGAAPVLAPLSGSLEMADDPLHVQQLLVLK